MPVHEMPMGVLLPSPWANWQQASGDYETEVIFCRQGLT